MPHRGREGDCGVYRAVIDPSSVIFRGVKQHLSLTVPKNRRMMVILY